MTCSGYHILLSYMLCHATLDKLAYYCKSNLERWYWKVLLTSNQTSLQFIFHQQHLNKCINKRFNFLKSEIFHMVQILWWPISWKYSQYSQNILKRMFCFVKSGINVAFIWFVFCKTQIQKQNPVTSPLHSGNAYQIRLCIGNTPVKVTYVGYILAAFTWSSQQWIKDDFRAQCVKTPKRLHWRRSGVFLLTLNRFHTLF